MFSIGGRKKPLQNAEKEKKAMNNKVEIWCVLLCFALILIRKKLRYVRFPPNLAHRKLIDLANYVPSSSPHRVLSFEKLESMAIWYVIDFWRLLRRTKACIDEFQPNTSQANYFEGFWSITSKTNTKIEVRKQFESYVRADRRFV